MKNRKCFFCKSTFLKHNDFIRVDNYKIFKCKKCNTASTFPHPSVNNLKKLYSNKDYRNKSGARFNIFFQYIFNIFKYLKYLRLKNFTKQKDYILDYGCGDGMLLYFFKKNGNNIQGAELGVSENIIINKIKIPIADSNKIFSYKKKFNLIILSQVLPHLKAPLILLKKLRNILLKDGVIYISQPNINSFGFKLFKEKWFHLDIPRHLYHFDKNDFINKMKKNDFYLIKKNSFELDHIFFGWLQSFLNIFLKKNLLFEYISFRKKKILFFDLISLIIVSTLIFPIALFFTILDLVNIINPSIIEYYFKKK